jgi:hypothetical protein
MLPNAFGDGARLLLALPDGTARVLSRGFHSAADPDVSFDGKRILFAAKRTAQENWNVYEITVDVSGLRQLTRGVGHCRSPGYQSSFYELSEHTRPWHQITFVGTRAGEVDEEGSSSARSLYTCNLDGTRVRRVTFNLSSEFDPHLMWDGRLVYASWERRTLDHGPAGRVGLMGVNLDGTDAAPFFVEGGRRIKHAPCATAGGLLVFVEADRMPWDGAGMLSCVTLRRPLHSYRPITSPADGLFCSPSPLPDGTILVSRRPAGGTGTHGVYRLDPSSNRMEPILDDPRYHDLQAKLVAPRAEPDGRSSSVNDDDPRGKLYCMNVYTTDFKDRSWMPPGSAKRLRVLEGVPRTAGERNAAQDSPSRGLAGAGPGPRSGIPQLAQRRILGEVPIPEDGSFNVDVPANTSLELQLLDENGMALRSCGWVWTRSHFPQGCVGCHEDPELTPENSMVAALEKPSDVVGRPAEQKQAIDFRRDVMPVIAKKCLPCHAAGGSPPLLAAGPGEPGGGNLDTLARRVYEILLTPDAAASEGHYRGKYVEPGRARTSPLVWHLFGRNTSRPWDGAAAKGEAKPIPATASEPLTPEEKLNLVKWIDVGAPWTAVPPAGSPAAAK